VDLPKHVTSGEEAEGHTEGDGQAHVQAPLETRYDAEAMIPLEFLDDLEDRFS
jgi:hypothetical protein